MQLIPLMLATVSEEWGLSRPYCAFVLHISMAILSEDPVLSRLNERTSRVSERNKNTTRHKADGSKHLKCRTNFGGFPAAIGFARSKLALEICFVTAPITWKVRKSVNNHVGKCTHFPV